MFCPECRHDIGENYFKYCPACGYYLQSVFNEPSKHNGNINGNIAVGGKYAPPSDNNGGTKLPVDMPMNWYKFLIYFHLIAGGVISFILGFVYFTGTQYFLNGENYTSVIYEVFPSLQIIDILMGMSTIALGAYSLIVRNMLKWKNESAPWHLMVFRIVTAASNLIFSLLYTDFFTQFGNKYGLGNVRSLFSTIGASIIIFSLITSLVLTAFECFYFSKRSHLFIN